MALCRLFVPVLPALLLVGARIASQTAPWLSLVRCGAAVLLSGLLFVKQGPAARGVLGQRLALIEQARSSLAGARRVATVDAGWVGAATEADIVDLAGVTDEFVARLPGGHTSKRLPTRFIENRGVDAAVLLAARPAADLRDAAWDRTVEYRVARQIEDLGFELLATLDLAGTSKAYLIFRNRNSQ
jgi:hypothetical protein